jgi:hypothetical protein
MANIKITRNCQNGEHVFIPALKHTDGRDQFVMAFVCQHCLYHVSLDEWENHIKDNFTNEPQIAEPEPEDPVKSVSVSTISPTIIKQHQQSYPGKKRGPKPKAQGKIEGLIKS